MNWPASLKARIKEDEPLAKHTTFRIGAAVRYFIEPRDSGDLKLLLSFLKRQGIPILVIGSGSNILGPQRYLNKVVLSLSAPAFKKISLKGNCLEAGCGVTLSSLVSLCRSRGLSGAEFLSGIPGTLGGALAMNAGIPSRNISDLVEEVAVMGYNSRERLLPREKIKFACRSSGLSRYIILGARLKLRKKDRQAIAETIRRYELRRRFTQDYRYPSAGCVFRNPPNLSAGRLIDLCGLKGKSIGGASVSLRHANFIVNRGQAEAGDVLRLMALVRKKVSERFGIDLQREIKVWK